MKSEPTADADPGLGRLTQPFIFTPVSRLARRWVPVCPRAKRIPQIHAAAAKVTRRIAAKNQGNDGQIELKLDPYFTWTTRAFSVASITAVKITSIRMTVERGKRNSGRILNLVSGVNGEPPPRMRRCSCAAPVRRPKVSRTRND